MSKYKSKDFVIYKPWSTEDTHGYCVMEVLEFDAIKNEYLCLDYDPYDLVPDCLYLCKEKDLVLVEESNFKDALPVEYMNYRKEIQLSKRELYSLSLYRLNGRNYELVRKAVQH